MTNICRNQVLHTGVHLISADVIILLIGAVNSNLPHEKRPKTGILQRRILRGWRTALGFAPGDKRNYKVPDTD